MVQYEFAAKDIPLRGHEYFCEPCGFRFLRHHLDKYPSVEMNCPQCGIPAEYFVLSNQARNIAKFIAWDKQQKAKAAKDQETLLAEQAKVEAQLKKDAETADKLAKKAAAKAKREALKAAKKAQEDADKKAKAEAEAKKAALLAQLQALEEQKESQEKTESGPTNDVKTPEKVQEKTENVAPEESEE